MFKHITKAFIILTFVFMNAVYAIDSEYKNSLNKIEFSKQAGDYYVINLYTQNRYTEPVKVIKKSDLNYYVLLPETKISSSKTMYNTEDIRTVNATVYPYAGQEVNNGYTKININTTKPIMFDVVVKNSYTPSTKTQSQNPSIASNTQNKQTEPAQVQKKNQKPVSQAAISGSVNSKKRENNKELKKEGNTAKEANKTKEKQTKTKQASNADDAKRQKETQPAPFEPKKNKTAKIQTINIDKKAQTNKIAKTDEKQPEVIIQRAAKIDEAIKQEIEEEADKLKQEEPSQDFSGEDVLMANPELQTSKEYSEVLFEDETALDGIDGVKLSENFFEPDFKTKLKITYNKFKNNLTQVVPKHCLIAIIALIILFIPLILVFKFVRRNKKRNKFRDIKLKSKKDLFKESLNKQNYTFRESTRHIKKFSDTKKINNEPKIEQKPTPKSKSEYFKFDGGVRQTKLCAPATSNDKKFQLQDYSPKISYEQPKVEPYKDKNYKLQKAQNDHEYDIIRRIIKEETFANIKPQELQKVAKPYDNNNSKNINEKTDFVKEESVLKKAISEPTATVSSVKVEQEVIRKTDEPLMLSSVEIAPQRGFMCIAYNDSINFMGYLFDDVFALYNFKQPELKSYDIQYRLAEKVGDNASFIVKVDDTKMMINVTRNSMKLEVVM